MSNTKQCTKCKQIKLLSDFWICKSHADGYSSQCIDCQKEHKKNYYLENKQQIRQQRKKLYNSDKNKQQCLKYQETHKDDISQNKKRYYLENREKILKQRQEYQQKNRNELINYLKEYRIKNKEVIKEKRRKKYLKNIEIIKRNVQEYYQNNKVICNQRKAKRNKIRRKTDIKYKIRMNLRGRLSQTLRCDYSKSKKMLELLGCSFDDFKQYFESKFTSGMTWEKFMNGEIHIDHILPCASFDLSKPEEQQKCFHYSNLQPLWAIDNLRKGAKLLTK